MENLSERVVVTVFLTMETVSELVVVTVVLTMETVSERVMVTVVLTMGKFAAHFIHTYESLLPIRISLFFNTVKHRH